MKNLTIETPKNSLSVDGASVCDSAPAKTLRERVEEAVAAVGVFDLHTHLFPAQFGALNLWGIDELLNYHYLIAETFRYSPISYAEFWRLPKRAQADLIWRTLFVENTPVSEATRGVVAVLSAFGLDPRARDLTAYREFFARQSAGDFIDRVLTMANVSDIVMTNDPLDDEEIKVWQAGEEIDARFHASLRLDRLLNGWTDAVPRMRKQGYEVAEMLDQSTLGATRRFLDDWIRRINPLYLGVSLPDDFAYPEETARGTLLREVIFPTCAEHGIALSLMIGVRRQVNPALKLAGDGVGRADVAVLAQICAANPAVKILATYLSRENQHELCVAARKFANLMPFGCWWFVNNPSIIAEITRERFELLGTSFIPQHSDARIIDQLIYKWKSSRQVIAEALFDSYRALEGDGWQITRAEMARDAEKLFAGNFKHWVGI